MKVKTLLEGKPFMTEYGIVGYSTVVLIACDDEKNILYDCGSKGCALQLKEALEKAGMKPEDITHVVISQLLISSLIILCSTIFPYLFSTSSRL